MGILDKLIPKNTNIFGATTPTYLSGIVDKDQLDLANKQSLFQGLLGTALGYIAQPKNQGYGSSLPYLAKSYMQGMQMAQSPYDRLERDVVMKEKFDQMALDKKREQDRKNLIANMYTTIPAETITTSTYQPIDQVGPGGERAIAPSYAPSQTTEVTVTPEQKILNQQKLMDFALQYPDQGGKFVDTITKLDALNRPQGTTQLSMEEKLKRRLPLTTEYQMNKEGTVTAIAGTEKKEIDYGLERNARASAIVNPNTGLPYESFQQLPVELRKQINADIELVKANNAKSMGGMEIGTSGNTDIDKALIAQGGRRSRLTALQNSFKPEYLTYGGKFDYAKFTTLEKINPDLLTDDQRQYIKEYKQFTVNAYDELNKYIKDITGAALSESEADRIRQAIADVDKNSPTEFKAALDEAAAQIQRAEARLLYLKKNGFKSIDDVSLGEFNSIIDQKGLEFEKQMLNSTVFNPQGVNKGALSEEQRKKLEFSVKQRLKEHFGLL